MEKYVAYYRVSTIKQQRSHLGLDAQQEMCHDFVKSKNGIIIKEFEEAESGKSRTRQGLWSAIAFCKENNCTLVIAKLDRLARDVEFTFKVINSGVQIHFCDMPMVNTMILGVFASVAQYERELISARTKAALDAKKARGEFWVRNTDTKLANIASAISRRNKAQNNQHNIFLFRYIQDWENENEEITRYTNKELILSLCNKLNNLGATTSTGLSFNPQRLRAMVTKIKELYKTK